MDELLTAQQSTWEEKEKLSQQLEEERQNNVNAAIGQVMLFIHFASLFHENNSVQTNPTTTQLQPNPKHTIQPNPTQRILLLYIMIGPTLCC